MSENVQSYKSKSQQFIDNIVHNVSSKQNELKQGALKSPSLYSPSIICEPQIFKEHYRNAEHGKKIYFLSNYYNCTEVTTYYNHYRRNQFLTAHFRKDPAVTNNS